MATLMEMLQKPLEERKELYGVTNDDKKIHEIEIDGQPFTGYNAFSFMWEKTYHKEPVRSSDGSIENLNSYTWFLTPRLTIDFSILSIDDYRRLKRLSDSKNEFTVTCYDVVNDRRTTNKMYFAPDELPKLLLINRALNGEDWIELLGVDGFTVEMIGTNSQLDTVSITYLQLNPATGDYSQSVSFDKFVGEEIIIGDGVDFKNDSLLINGVYYTFSGIWYRYKLSSTGRWIQDSYAPYRDNSAMALNTDLILGVAYRRNYEEPVYKLTLNYGLGEVKKDAYGEPVYSISVKNGEQLILSNYTTKNPKVTFFGKEYTPYIYKGWFYTQIIGIGSTNVDGTYYNLTTDTTIYQLYENIEYTITLQPNTTETSYQPITAKYGERIAIPLPLKKGYNFVGWYYEATLQNKFDGTMPPLNTTIYGKWELAND